MRKRKEIQLLEGPIMGSLLRLAAPLMLTAFIQMAYNLTDSFWIGRLGKDAVAGTGIAGFIVWFSQSLILIPRVGVGTLAAQSYGRNEKEQTLKVVEHGLQLAVFISLCFMLITWAGQRLFIGFYDLNAQVETAANTYIRIIAAGYFISFINPIFSQAYNSIGDSMTPFRLNALGLILNVILDPLFIFGLDLGVAGAAIATLLAQVVVTLAFLWKNRSSALMSKIRFFRRPDWNLYTEISKLGIPACIQNATHAIVSMVLNKFMALYGSAPVAVYSIGSQIESISWMTTDGFSVAIGAMVGQNYGAGKYQRVEKTIKAGLKTSATIGGFATLVLILFRAPLFHLFMPHDPEVAALGADYLLIFGFSQLFMTLEIGATGVFNGLGDTAPPSVVSGILNVARIPFALFLMPLLGVHGVWWAMSISSILKGVVLLLVFSFYHRKEKYYMREMMS